MPKQHFITDHRNPIPNHFATIDFVGTGFLNITNFEFWDGATVAGDTGCSACETDSNVVRRERMLCAGDIIPVGNTYSRHWQIVSIENCVATLGNGMKLEAGDTLYLHPEATESEA